MIFHNFMVHLLRSWRILHTVLAGGVLTAWVTGLNLLVRNRHQYRRLDCVKLSPSEMAAVPTLSILVPACNEAATVERGMRSLLALQYPCMEVIAVNDRSDDATGAILDKLALEDSRLRVVHIATLPSGWLGKNHALQVAGEEAIGEWLLFTDADVVFRPDALLRAVSYAHACKIDHLVLAPRFESHGFWERLFLSYFSLMFSFRTRPWEISNPRRSAFIGFGVFNLVRASRYRTCGGHDALPMEVADDTKLGKVIKRSGFRAELLDGSELLSVRWIIGLSGAVEGLTKNAFAGYEFNLPRAVSGVVALTLTALYPVISLALPVDAARLMAVLTLFAMMGGAIAMKRLTDAGALYGLAYPIGGVVLIYVILRSICRTYRQNGVFWRGTFYPLDELRKGVV